MTTKREPVVMAMSILAALQFLFGGMGGIAYFSDRDVWAAAAALGTLVVAAAQVGVQFWVRGQVTPVEDALPQRADAGFDYSAE